MTINIILQTNDALILGCDSTASSGSYYIDPFALNPIPAADGSGKLTLEFTFEQMQHIITDAWEGVTKMFSLCDEACHVAGVTSGLATLNQRSMASLAAEFKATLKKRKKIDRPTTVKGVADEFLSFMRKEYEKHYEGSTIPQEYREGPEFLIGGFAGHDKFPSSYRVIVQRNRVYENFANGATGLVWGAQSDAVERIVRGYDQNLRTNVEKAFQAGIAAFQQDVNKAALRIIDEILQKLNSKMPDGVDTTLPSEVTIEPQWDNLKTQIPYASLPLQEAVNFVSYLIMMQAGKMRFSRGLATVGGRIHIGVITHEEGFRKLNEPELSHHYTGFSQ